MPIIACITASTRGPRSRPITQPPEEALLQTLSVGPDLSRLRAYDTEQRSSMEDSLSMWAGSEGAGHHWTRLTCS
jgi:hypothetical protein